MSKSNAAVGKPPATLRQDNITAQIIRDDIWRPAAQQNDWRVFAVVGREGSGKSLTCASILRAADPTFGAGNIHFEPVPFLQDISQQTERPGVGVMSDESGVGFGNRTWHDREQVEANQALQTARDYNRIVGLTLPRFEELDKQLRGRVHVLVETVKKNDGEWVEVKWKRLDPTRDGRNKLYKEYPKRQINGRTARVTRLRIGPPPQELIDAYQPKKAAWKRDLFDRVIDTYDDEDDGDEELDETELSEAILDEGVDQFMGDNHGQQYLDADLIAIEHDIALTKAKRVKKLLLNEVDRDDLM